MKFDSHPFLREQSTLFKTNSGLTDFGALRLVRMTSGTPYKITDELLHHLPLSNILGLCKWYFYKFSERKSVPVTYRYTLDPFNENYDPESSWLWPQYEGWDFEFQVRNNTKVIRTDLVGLIKHLQASLPGLPVPWMRQYYRLNTAEYAAVLASKDYEAVFRCDGNFYLLQLHRFGGKYYAYDMEYRPHLWHHPIKYADITRYLPLTGRIADGPVGAKDFSVMVYVHSVDPITPKPVYELADVLYFDGRDMSQWTWKNRKKRLKDIALALNIRPPQELTRGHVPGKTVILKHPDSQLHHFDGGSCISPRGRWYTFFMNIYEPAGEYTKAQFSLFEGGKMVPFTPKMDVLSKKFYSRATFYPGMVVTIYADTLVQASKELVIYGIRPSKRNIHTSLINSKGLFLQ